MRLYNRYTYMSKEWFFLQFKPNSYHQTAKNLCQQGLKHFYPFIAPLHEMSPAL